MNEDTLVKTLPLPYGREWLRYADANVVVLSPCLDAAGRERALREAADEWRRSCLGILPEQTSLTAMQPPTTLSPVTG